MHARGVSRIFLALGLADLAVMNLVLAPRLAAHDARPPVAAPMAPVAAAPPPCAAAPSAAATAEAAAPVVAEPAPADVLFAFDGQRLTAESTAELQRVGLVLRDAPERRVLLRGHADRLGSPERNLALSRRRAEAVQRYLVALGAPQERIGVEAVGDAEPVDRDDGPAAWARNRRVQILWR